MNVYLLLAHSFSHFPSILLISKTVFWYVYQSHKVLIRLTVDYAFPSITVS